MRETALKIRLFPDPVLRKRIKPLKEITSVHRDILSRMAVLMYESCGVGLAAPQVGLGEAMIVADIGSGLYKLINPRIIKKEGLQAREEGCLSLPGISIKVRRAKKILIEARDEFFKPVKIEAQDLLACVFQHEIDHLKGKLIIDYGSFWDKIKIKEKIKKLKNKKATVLRKEGGSEKLPESKTESYKLQLQL